MSLRRGAQRGPLTPRYGDEQHSCGAHVRGERDDQPSHARHFHDALPLPYDVWQPLHGASRPACGDLRLFVRVACLFLRMNASVLTSNAFTLLLQQMNELMIGGAEVVERE